MAWITARRFLERWGQLAHQETDVILALAVNRNVADHQRGTDHGTVVLPDRCAGDPDVDGGTITAQLPRLDLAELAAKQLAAVGLALLRRRPRQRCRKRPANHLSRRDFEQSLGTGVPGT